MKKGQSNAINKNSDLLNVMESSQKDDQSTTFLTAGLNFGEDMNLSKADPRDSIRIQRVRDNKDQINQQTEQYQEEVKRMQDEIKKYKQEIKKQ